MRGHWYMGIITVIGSGVMGSAMSFPASYNGHIVRLVGTKLDIEIINHLRETDFHLNLKRKLPDGVEYYQPDELDIALKNVDLIISGVSSFGVDWFCNDILTLLPVDIPVLSVTKGMINNSDGSLTSYPKHYSDLYPGRDFCAIGGPCTSYELADSDNTCVAFCGNNPESLQMMKKLLETPYYHIELSTDIEGLECAVALKNAYALTVSLAVGLSLKNDDIIHYNSQAALFGQSILEMRKLLDLFGFKDDNIVFSAGDLYVTVFGGRTRKIGTLLGMGQSYDEAMKELSDITLESVVITERVGSAVLTCIESGKVSKDDFPLLLHIFDIITKNVSVNIPWKKFGRSELN